MRFDLRSLLLLDHLELAWNFKNWINLVSHVVVLLFENWDDLISSFLLLFVKSWEFISKWVNNHYIFLKVGVFVFKKMLKLCDLRKETFYFFLSYFLMSFWCLINLRIPLFDLWKLFKLNICSMRSPFNIIHS